MLATPAGRTVAEQWVCQPIALGGDYWTCGVCRNHRLEAYGKVTVAKAAFR
jgi:hypothetical protein